MLERIEKRIAAVRNKLNQKFLRQISPKIHVREVIGFHSLGETGEFSVKASIKETKLDIISRMVKNMDEIAAAIIPLHLTENYEQEPANDPSEPSKITRIKNGRENHITQVTLDEFSYFLQKTVGPISVDEFSDLIKKLEAKVVNYPENFYLMLGTISVRYENNVVRNMGIHIQCGKKPVIHTFVKKVPFERDPQYPNTSNIDFLANRSTAWLNTMSKKLSQTVEIFYQFQSYEQLTEHFKSPRFQREFKIISDQMLQSLSELKQAIANHGDNVDIEANLLIQEIDLLSKNIITVQGAKTVTNFKEIHSEFIKLFETLVADYNVFIQAHLDERVIALKKLPSGLLPRSFEEPITIYDGNIICKTAGGVIFHLAMDICLDHRVGAALSSMESSIALSQMKGQFTFPPQANYLISSHTAKLNPDNSPAYSVIQADPLNSAVKQKKEVLLPEKKIAIPKPAFGSPLTLWVYPSRELLTHTEPYQQDIERQNKFALELQVLRIVRCQQPKHLPILNEKIIQHIVDQVIEAVSDMSIDLKSKLEKNPLEYDVMLNTLAMIKEELTSLLSIKIDRARIEKCLSIILHAESQLRIDKDESDQLASSIVSQQKTKTFIHQNNARPHYAESVALSKDHPKQTVDSNNPVSEYDCNIVEWPLEDDAKTYSLSCKKGPHTLHLFEKIPTGEDKIEMPESSRCQSIGFYSRQYLRCETENKTILASTQTPAERFPWTNFTTLGEHFALWVVGVSVLKKTLGFFSSPPHQRPPDLTKQLLTKTFRLQEKLSDIQESLQYLNENFKELRLYYKDELEWNQNTLVEIGKALQNNHPLPYSILQLQSDLNSLENELKQDIKQNHGLFG